MRVVLQRVTHGEVSVEGNRIGEIGRGYVLLLGIAEHDTKQTVDYMVDKIKKQRLFPDDQGKTNLSIDQVAGQVLVVSQFTLYADCKKGTRPSFAGAGSPQLAEELYLYFVQRCQDQFAKTACGQFGAEMQVTLTNDGPFTLLLEG